MQATLLAIETSCDETSAAVVRDGAIASVVISSQLEHRDWGGVVPELASRAHLRMIGPIVGQALRKAGTTMQDIQAVAVTVEPGLIGALLVGVNAAKGIAVGRKCPLVAVNHLEAHLYSIFIEHTDVAFPYVGLVVSGGHTLLYLVHDVGRADLLGSTRDDAAGEAFDKGAKLLGLGYPGGPEIDRLARDGDPHSHRFPRALTNDPGHDFSFSGLKTSLRYYLRDHHPDGPPNGQELADICAAYQSAIVEALVARAMRAVKQTGARAVAAVGGVSVNAELRRRLREEAERADVGLYAVDPIYSTDNAAMIGIVGWHKFVRGIADPLSTIARASTVRSKLGRGPAKGSTRNRTTDPGTS